MTEYQIGLISTCRLLIPIITGLLYWIGGNSEKKYRRFLAPIFLVLFCLIITINPIVLISYPLYVLAYSVGYGINSFLIKIFKNKIIVRAICGSLYALASMPIVIVTGAWILFSIHLILVSVTSVIFGTQIIKLHAPEEENIIGTVSAILVPWMV